MVFEFENDRNKNGENYDLDFYSSVSEQEGCCAHIIRYYSQGQETANPQQEKAWIEVQACLNRISECLEIIKAESIPDKNLQCLENAIRLIGFRNDSGKLEKAPWNFNDIFYYYNNLSNMNNSMLGYWVKRLGIALAAAAAGCAAGFKLSGAVAAPILGPWAPVVGGVLGGAVGFFGSRAALSSKEKLYAEINTLGEKFSKVKGFNEQKANITEKSYQGSYYFDHDRGMICWSSDDSDEVSLACDGRI